MSESDGLVRIIEGDDKVYKVVALKIERFNKNQDFSIALIIEIPYTKQLMHKSLTPDEARKLAQALKKNADLVEKFRDETFSVEPI